MSRVAYEYRPTALKSLSLILRREIKLYWRNKAHTIHSMLFFLISITICKLTTNQINTNLLLILLFFSMMYSTHHLLQNDFRKNILEQFLLLGINPMIVLGAKLIAYWMLIGTPFIIAMMLFHFIMIPEHDLLLISFISIMIVMNVSIVCLFTSALCLYNENSILLSILTMPFIIPTMIFASLAMENTSYCWMLIAIYCFTMILFVYPSAFVIKAISRAR